MDHIHRVYTIDQVNPAQAHLLPQESGFFGIFSTNGCSYLQCSARSLYSDKVQVTGEQHVTYFPLNIALIAWAPSPQACTHSMTY